MFLIEILILPLFIEVIYKYNSMHNKKYLTYLNLLKNILN